MLQRGRKSLANVTTFRVAGQPSRVEPPRYLTAPERKLFVALVAAVNAKHFTESDTPLLISYVQATALAQQAIKEARKDTGALLRWEKAVKLQAVLATRLRLAPQSRIDRKAVTRNLPSPGPLPWEQA